MNDLSFSSNVERFGINVTVNVMQVSATRTISDIVISSNR